MSITTKIEGLAKILATQAGVEPDALVSFGNLLPAKMGPAFTQVRETRPEWMGYVSAAENLIEQFDYLRGSVKD